MPLLADEIIRRMGELGLSSGSGEHTHAIDEVADLQGALDSKAAAGHDHDADYAAIGHTHEAGSSWEFPVGWSQISFVDINPATFLGYGTWVKTGAGRVLVGFDANDADFNAAEKTGGAKTVASTGTVSQPTFSGTPFSSVINHTHSVTITDAGHAHTVPVGATDDTAAPFDRADAGTNASGANAATSTGTATTGITATTANPAGGVASITPAGTVSQPTFSGSAASVVQPYLVVYFWERTA
jgi:hypothetical protein